MAITIRQIQAFRALAELGTFTKAAERLHIAQPALSLLIRDLEGELGIRLLDRTTRRVELTAAGREFEASAARILGELEIALQNASSLAKRERGRISVAAPPLLAAVVLPKAIAALKKGFPGLHVSILDARNDLVADAVRLGKADCGIGTFSALEDSIDQTPISRDELMLFCSPKATLGGEPRVSWAELENETLITLTRDSAIRVLVEVGFESAQIPFRPSYEVAQITTALALVECDLGVAVLPTYARAVASAQIVSRPLSEPTIARDIVMIRPSGRSMSPALAAFEGLLRRFVRELTPAG